MGFQGIPEEHEERIMKFLKHFNETGQYDIHHVMIEGFLYKLFFNGSWEVKLIPYKKFEEVGLN